LTPGGNEHHKVSEIGMTEKKKLENEIDQALVRKGKGMKKKKGRGVQLARKGEISRGFCRKKAKPLTRAKGPHLHSGSPLQPSRRIRPYAFLQGKKVNPGGRLVRS